MSSRRGRRCTFPRVTTGYSLSGQLTTSCAAGTLTLATCVADSPAPAAAAACKYVTPDNGSDGAQNVKGSCKSVVTGGNNDKQLELGATCTPECAEGFELSGVMTSSCSAEGIFTPATCLPVDNTKCTMQLPDSASAGTCTGEELASGATCTPECKDGYTLSGQLTTSCAAGTLTLATCVGNACTMQLPDSASAGTCTGEELASGATCTPECKDGVTVIGTAYDVVRGGDSDAGDVRRRQSRPRGGCSVQVRYPGQRQRRSSKCQGQLQECCHRRQQR
jgi:hypothetical protein